MGWDNDNKKLLLAFAKNNRQFMEALGGHIDPQDLFRTPAMEDMSIALEAMTSFYRDNGHLPEGPQMLESQVEDVKREFPLVNEDNHTENAKDLIKGAYTLSGKDLNNHYDIGEGMIKEFVWQFNYKTSLVSKIKNINSLEKGLTVVEDEVERMSAIRHIGDSLTSDPYDDPASHINLRKKEGTSLDWWNALFPGGIMKGNIYYILGPTGGGKSAMMTQLAWTFSMTGRIYFCLFEGQHDRPINPGEENVVTNSYQLQRFMCQTGQIGLDDFAIPEDGDKDIYTVDDLPKANKMHKVLGIVKNRLHNKILVHDGTESKGPVSVGALLDDIKREHEKESIAALFLDPLRQLVEETIVAEGLSGSDDLFRRRAMKFADEITNFADENAIPVFLSHQLRATDADRKGTKEIGAYAGGEARTMSWPFQNVIVICPHRHNGKTHIVVPKSRMEGAKNRFVKVRFDGEHQQFNLIDNESQQFLAEEDAEDEEQMDKSITNILQGQDTVEGVRNKSFNKSDDDSTKE